MPTLAAVACQAVTAAQMRSPEYRALRDALHMPEDMHRKYWEFAYIARALETHDALRPGARGLGFAVGLEPLPAYFASRGCTVVATDLAPDAEASKGWIESGQHLASKAALNEAGICAPAVFDDHVAVRWVDMTRIDGDLRDFDFTWSSCAFEHVGSVDAGLAFVRNQMACLRPGGVSVHTTELNISSETDTIDAGPTVLFTRPHMRHLLDTLRADGHAVAAVTFRLGSDAADREVVVAPYTQQSPHLKIQVGPYVTTSFGIIVTKATT